MDVSPLEAQLGAMCDRENSFWSPTPSPVVEPGDWKVLAGKLKPNLGRFDNPPDWQVPP